MPKPTKPAVTPKTKGVKRPDAPMSETLLHKDAQPRPAEECVEILRTMAAQHPDKVISRNFFRVNGPIAESVWNRHFGTFHEFKRQAGLVLTRQQHNHEKKLAKHASVDHYRRLSAERSEWGENYLRPSNRRFQVGIFCSDLHDKECDPFFLRVLIDTFKRIRPDLGCFVGDVYDLPEFGKYGVDPRDWDVVGRIKFVHNKIWKQVREASPDTQLDVIEGNHEARLLRHLCDATPALRAVLADLHGMTVSKLLGLDEFGINYVAKADLAAYSESDLNDELRNNYRIYWGAFLAHHFPDGRTMMLPGVNGHHHRHHVWTSFNPVYGSVEWHQMGCGHRRDASYCAGEKWNMGFDIVLADTWTRTVHHEYVTVGENAMAGGKLYTRTDAERTGLPRLLEVPALKFAA